MADIPELFDNQAFMYVVVPSLGVLGNISAGKSLTVEDFGGWTTEYPDAMRQLGEIQRESGLIHTSTPAILVYQDAVKSPEQLPTASADHMISALFPKEGFEDVVPYELESTYDSRRLLIGSDELAHQQQFLSRIVHGTTDAFNPSVDEKIRDLQSVVDGLDSVYKKHVRVDGELIPSVICVTVENFALAKELDKDMSFEEKFRYAMEHAEEADIPPREQWEEMRNRDRSGYAGMLSIHFNMLNSVKNQWGLTANEAVMYYLITTKVGLVIASEAHGEAERTLGDPGMVTPDSLERISETARYALSFFGGNDPGLYRKDHVE